MVSIVLALRSYGITPFIALFKKITKAELYKKYMPKKYISCMK